MYFGIIAEGRSDVAVIENILKGMLSIDKNLDIQHLQPEFDLDETDSHTLSPGQFSNWNLVRDACIEKRKLEDFFSIDEERYIVIHIDTAEAGDIGYEAAKPAKPGNSESSRILRQNVINKFDEWLNTNDFQGRLFFAIAIEEIEAWVLTIYTEQQNDTCMSNDPKDKLYRVLNKKLSAKQRNVLKKGEYEKFDELSKLFRKKKKLRDCSCKNESLKLFCESLDVLCRPSTG
ncbi:Uncharacterized protein dnl_31390 [Desulfonema limicola]|uniref:DUF4276 family protein n=1 Tax=Desulfonema limicola TaxID=45656 RepID=A0A975B8W5_9BACT|nr:hypothetical protein [Desulfonema limicola]QTA80826.1 Uncharacterized protein dnl_31390 [Desulfonema limicola]